MIECRILYTFNILTLAGGDASETQYKEVHMDRGEMVSKGYKHTKLGQTSPFEGGGGISRRKKKLV